MDELNMAKAREMYDVLCRMMDNKGWHYEKEEEDLIVKSGVKGNDFPIEFIIRVNPRNELVSFFSKLPFNVEEDKRIDVALAICAVNYWLADGSFDYDLSDGSILFRLTSSYKESTLGEALFEYMVIVSAATVDNYNDKFFMMSKGMMTYQQFIEAHDD